MTMFAKDVMTYLTYSDIRTEKEGVNVGEKLTKDIHNSDRKSFKQCRRSYYFSNRSKLGLEPNVPNKNLAFGNAIHRGLENYYLGGSEIDATKAFEKRLNQFNLNDDDQFDLQQLGRGMIKNFFAYAKLDKMEVIAVEKDFSIPIEVKDRPYLEKTEPEFNIGENKVLLHKGIPVHCAGTVDLLVKNSKDEYWVIDHKTTGKMTNNLNFLNTDEQITTYIWAMKKLGYNVKGFIYQELLKRVPSPIKPLKRKRLGRSYSVSMSTPVILDQFIVALMNAGEDLELYKDYLKYLSQNPNPFFRRTFAYRNEHELTMFEHILFYEAIEMLSSTTTLFPRPSYFGCNTCMYSEPCVAMNRGHDWEFILDNQFSKRKVL